MDWLLGLLTLVVIMAIVKFERHAGTIRRDMARIDHKLNVLLTHLNIHLDEFSGLSERAKELACDPKHKLAAIKLHREETGASLSEAKEAVGAYADSLQGKQGKGQGKAM